MFELHFELLRLTRRFSALEGVLQSLGTALASATEQLSEENPSTWNPEYAEILAEEIGMLIEDLLGASFVSCQTRLNAVISRIMPIHKHAGELDYQLTCCQNKKRSILRCGCSLVKGTEFSEMQVIDAAANYFKHRSEWVAGWKTLNRNQRHNADIIIAAGASPGCNHNLRTISESLGNNEFSNTQAFFSTIVNWQRELEQIHWKELVSVGLVRDRT